MLFCSSADPGNCFPLTVSEVIQRRPVDEIFPEFMGAIETHDRRSKESPSSYFPQTRGGVDVCADYFLWRLVIFSVERLARAHGVGENLVDRLL